MKPIPTPLVRHPPIIMLVGLDADTARRCAAAIAPLPTMRIDGPEAALDRLLVVRPMVVVVPGDSLASELKTLRERVTDVVGVLIGLEGVEDDDDAELARRLRGAAEIAERRRSA